tara:strand:- start:737 stop:958 length:222 start_codon:yes stop_codon:yes gene_type:complete
MIEERLKWILGDEEIASYIHEKERAYEEFEGQPLPWNVSKYTVQQVIEAIVELDLACDDLEDEIKTIEEYLEE